MYLVDTSVWIDYFRENDTKAVLLFTDILEKNIPFGITSMIYQEILQGAASEKDFKELVNYLGTQRFFHPSDSLLTYENAAKLYFECRKKGLTIRSTVDCFIAQIAIEHALVLLHNDKDFLYIKKVNPKLKVVE